jgi:hypothetical protein
VSAAILDHALGDGEFETGYRDVAARKAGVIVASGTEVALKTALAAPIVMVAIDYDPLVRGYVTSLARPTGRVTGLFFQQIELTVKRVQLLKHAFPDIQAATVFWDQISADQWEAARSAGATLRKRVGTDVMAAQFHMRRSIGRSLHETRVHIGDQDVSRRPDAVRHPGRNRTAAAADIEAVPARADAGRLEKAEGTEVVQCVETAETLRGFSHCGVVEDVRLHWLGALRRGRAKARPHVHLLLGALSSMRRATSPTRMRCLSIAAANIGRTIGGQDHKVICGRHQRASMRNGPGRGRMAMAGASASPTSRRVGTLITRI